MRRITYYSILFVLISILVMHAPSLCATSDSAAAKPVASPSVIRVGVFNGNGASGGCIRDTLEALKIDKAIRVGEITANDIIKGALDKLDVLVFPGGGGSRQVGNMGYMAIRKVKDFVLKAGKGLVGICAGAYLLSDTPNYACLHLFPIEAIDHEHDERGRGIIEFLLTQKGMEIFPELKEGTKHFIYYYEGPICIPAKSKAPYTNLATMVSDVHLRNDAPAGMTPGKPMYMNTEMGKGRMFLSVTHPETTPGMRWMVPRMVRWAARRDLVPYPAAVVRPYIYNKEILFDATLMKKESALLQTLLYGDSLEKANALKELVEIHSWSARNWFPGLLRDKSSEVRLAAAKALADIGYTAAIEDLRTVVSLEADGPGKKQMEKYLAILQGMIGH
ncbi:MAG: biofilm PGA synthesis protein PgaB [bacterium]|nr:biofilm PGA synthesis protein PgaB [bacterium]